MKKGIMTVGFMTVITVFFITILAVLNAGTRGRIIRNENVQRMRALLYACNIFPDGLEEKNLPKTSTTSDIPWNAEHVLTMVQSRIQTLHLSVPPSLREMARDSFLSLQDSAEILVIWDADTTIIGYGFSLRGKGLWGTISAIGVISSDLRRMIGIDFTDQVETPGLGARITELGFKYFFRGLDLTDFLKSRSGSPIIRMVAKKEVSNLQKPSASIQAITGATQTCNGVLAMVNTDLRFYIRLLHFHDQEMNSLKRGAR